MSTSLQELYDQFSKAFPRPAAPAAEQSAAPSAQGAHEAKPPLTSDGGEGAQKVGEEAPQNTASQPPPEEPPPDPVRRVDYTKHGYHLDVSVPSDQIVAAAEMADQNGLAIDTVTGVDWIADEQLEVVYDFYHTEANLRLVLRTRIPRNNPEIQTISEVFPGANWHERETHDFFGINFLGHPDLSPFLLPEDADFHPLLKDYTP